MYGETFSGKQFFLASTNIRSRFSPVMDELIIEQQLQAALTSRPELHSSFCLGLQRSLALPWSSIFHPTKQYLQLHWNFDQTTMNQTMESSAGLVCLPSPSCFYNQSQFTAYWPSTIATTRKMRSVEGLNSAWSMASSLVFYIWVHLAAYACVLI
jgi:hypothetical protein